MSTGHARDSSVKLLLLWKRDTSTFFKRPPIFICCTSATKTFQMWFPPCSSTDIALPKVTEDLNSKHGSLYAVLIH